MATDNTDIFPENITRILEKMDKTIEENSSNLNENIDINLNANLNTKDVDDSIVNLDKKIDETLNVLDRGIDQHKGAFDIWKTFGVDLDTESFGSDDANKDRTDKDAVYDQLALLAKVLNKNPKLIGTLTSLNGKNLKLVLGDSNNRADYLNRAEKVIDLEHGIISDSKKYDSNTTTVGFISRGHNTIAASKSNGKDVLDSTLFHEYGHLILERLLDSVDIQHGYSKKTVSEFIDTLQNYQSDNQSSIDNSIEDRKRIEEDIQRYENKIKEKQNDRFVDLWTRRLKQRKHSLIDIDEYINTKREQNNKILNLIELFNNINNAPDKLGDDEYIDNVHEVFARSFKNYILSMSTISGGKPVSDTVEDIDDINYTQAYNNNIKKSFIKIFNDLEGENISSSYQILFDRISGKNLKGLNTTEITNIINRIAMDSHSDSDSAIDAIQTFLEYVKNNNINLSKYKYSPTNIANIESMYASYDDDVHTILYNLLASSTDENQRNRIKKLGELGRLIQSNASFENIQKISEILRETGYDNLSVDEIKKIRNKFYVLTDDEQRMFRDMDSSLDAAMTKIPTSETENIKYEEKIKQDVESFNAFADVIKSLSDTFKNSFESAIENSASYFKKAFESAIVSYGDVLARMGSGKNPFTDNAVKDASDIITQTYESRVGTPFVTKTYKTVELEQESIESLWNQLKDNHKKIESLFEQLGNGNDEEIQKEIIKLHNINTDLELKHPDLSDFNNKEIKNLIFGEPITEDKINIKDLLETNKKPLEINIKPLENDKKLIFDKLNIDTTKIDKNGILGLNTNKEIKNILSGESLEFADGTNEAIEKLNTDNQNIKQIIDIIDIINENEKFENEIDKSVKKKVNKSHERRKQRRAEERKRIEAENKLYEEILNEFKSVEEIPMTWTYNREPDFSSSLNTLTNTSDDIIKDIKEPVIEDAVIVGTPLSTDDTFNRAIRKAAFINPNAPLMLEYDNNQYFEDSNTIVANELKDILNEAMNEEASSILGYNVSDNFKDNDEIVSILKDITEEPLEKSLEEPDEFSKMYRDAIVANLYKLKDTKKLEHSQLEDYNSRLVKSFEMLDIDTLISKLLDDKTMYDAFAEASTKFPELSKNTNIGDTKYYAEYFKRGQALMLEDKGYRYTAPDVVYDDIKAGMAKAIYESGAGLPAFPSEQDVIDALPAFPSEIEEAVDSNEEYAETLQNASESIQEQIDAIDKTTEEIKKMGLDYQKFGKHTTIDKDGNPVEKLFTDRTIQTAGKEGFDAGGRMKNYKSTEEWIQFVQDEDENWHWEMNVPKDVKNLKEFMDKNEEAVHMMKHLEDYFRFQHNNPTNMEVTPLEYLNYKYGERAQNLQKRMGDTDSGFASTIYKIGGQEHTYSELMESDAILRNRISKFNELVDQISNANKDDINPLTTYKWLRELSELEKDIKKRTANVIKEQQTIYKELSDISKEGEKIAEEGIKQADKMLAGDSTYKSIFGKYKIPELSRSGKFSLTDSEKAITEFYKDQIKTQQELLKDTTLDKSGREKIRNEIKNLNEQLNDYTTGTIADRAKEISSIEDSYKKNVIPMLDKFNKTFGHVFNTNADIDFEAVRQGGFGKLKELSKFINLDKIFNVDNIKKYAAELSKNIGTMFDSGIKMFQSAFSKITSIVGSVVKHVTILITGAFATVTAAVTGFVAGFTAMGKSIVSATDVYRKQTIALGGVYQSPTKTNRMINSVYDVTRSMPINYTQAVQTLSEMSAIPALQTILKSNDTQKADQLMTKMFKVITAMTTMRPDQRSSDAIFSLRNAFAGDLRSLQRRFDLPTSNIMNVRGTMGLAAVKTDPMAMLDSLENYFDSFLDVGTINKISDTISVIVEKIKGAIDLFKANIGNAGFYELVAEDFRKIRDVVVNFVTSEDGKNLAKRISDVFGNVYESVKSMAVKVKDIIAGVFNIDSNTLSGMFMKGLEFFAKSVNYIDKLLNIETVTNFVKDLVKTIVDSKDTVLGYIDDIKNKFIDIVEPVLKFAEVVTDAMNDIINVLKKTGLSDKGIIYLWLLGPSNVLNMIIGGIGAIKAAIGLLVVSTGILYNSISSIYKILKPTIALMIGGLKKAFAGLLPYAATIGTIAATIGTIAVGFDFIYHNFERIGELGMDVFGSIAIALEPVTNTLSDMWDIVDHMFAIGDNIIKSLFNTENWKIAITNVIDIITDVFKMGMAKLTKLMPSISWITGIENPDEYYNKSYDDLLKHVSSVNIPESIKNPLNYHTSEISKIWNRNRFGVWDRMSEGDFSDFTNLYEANAELYNPEGKEISFENMKTAKIINGALSWIGDKTMAVDKSISSIPDKISNFFKWFVSDEKSDSSILNSSNKTLGLIKNGLDYIKNNMKSSKSETDGGKLFDSIIKFASNPLKSIYNAVTGTTLNSYSAPYESPMWNKRLTSMALDVDRLQFQRGSIWSRNAKSDKSEKMFKTDYGEFGFGGLQELNLKKLDNLKNINKILDEVGKVKLNEKDQEDFDKNFQQNLETARKKTEEIDNLIRDNIEASVMLMQDALGSSKLNYLKNDVMQFVMAKNRQLNSQLEQDMNDSIRLQYAVYFASNNEFDETLIKLREKYHDVNAMYADISNGNVDLKDMTELGRQILTEFAKRYEAERDYLWNLEKQRAYIEVTTQNINKMGLSELSGNWSNLMNSPYKKIRDAAGNQYMDIMKENLEQDTVGSMVRKVRDVAINSFTDMKNAVINAVQEIVKSTQQTIKNGLDKFIAEGGTVKPMFKELFENIKKNFFGIYTNEAANKLTEFIYGSSFEDNKTQDPMIKLDTDIKDFNTSVLQKMDEVIASNEKFLNDAFNKWLEENNKSKQETPLYRGSAYIVEKQGSNLAPLDSKYADFNTISNGVATRRATDIGKDSNKYDEFINEASRLYDIDSSLIKAVINTESSFKMLKANKAGAIGLMQVTSGALSDVNRKFGTNYNITNPKDNIMAGTGYLRMMLDKFGNENLALAAYNAGAGNVIKYKGIPDFKETQNYIPTVNMFKDVFDNKNTTSKTVEKPISSIDNNIEQIKNEITNVTNGDISNITRTGYVNSIVNKEIVNTIDNSINPEIKNTLDDMNFELKLDGESGGNRFSGFNIEGLNLKLDGGTPSNILSSIPMINLSFNKDTGIFDSAILSETGSNLVNSAVNMAGAGFGGVTTGINVAKLMNQAGSKLRKPETQLKGIWGDLFGTVENVESKFGGASVGSFLGNMMSGKGIWDSFASANTIGASTFESLKGANSFTKVATGLTSTLLGKTAGSSVAKALTGTKILGTSLGTALPVVGAVANVLSKKGWFGGAKDRTAEGRARGDEFNSLRNSLIANRDTLARNYYMANDDTLDALKNYQFGEVAMWTSRRGHKWNGTKRTIMNTDATAFVNSMQGYWDLLQRADEENRATQRSLNKLQNTNNMEYLVRTGSYEEKRRNDIQDELTKYKSAVSAYAGHDTGFTQTLFDGQSYTMTQLNDKIQDLIKELGDSSDAIAQNTEAIRQEKLATESSRLDYITALYGDINPSIAQINNKQKLENEWNSIINDDGSIGYVKDTKEYWDYMTRLTQANRELKNAQKQQSIDLSTNWISDLRGIAMENGTYDTNQIKNLSNLYGKRENLKVQIQNAVDNMDSALAEKLYDESQAITEEIEHYKSSTSFSNSIHDAIENMNNIFDNVTVKPINSLSDNVNSIMDVIKQSEQWIKDAGYSGYDELDSSVLLPLFQSSFGNVNEMSSIFTEGLKSGVFDTTQINPFKEYSNNLMTNLDSFKTDYRELYDSGATKQELNKLVKTYQETVLANVTGMNSEYEKMFKTYQQDITASSILSSMSGFEDYTVANDALKEFNDTLGAGAMEKLIGYVGDFDSESLGKFMNVSGLTGDSDPYEMYHEWEKKHIMQRIENSEEGSEEWYAAELELWNLMADNAKYLKEKAEKTTATIEEMLGKIEETARTRVAEEAKSAKGDIVFFDLGSSREGTQFINKMLDGIDANTPESQKFMKTLKQKLMGVR